MRRDFVFVSGNAGKLRELARLLGFAPEAAPLDLPELQSLDLTEILHAKAAAAWERLGRPVVVEDVGLELAGLNGFPGPLVKWMLAAVGPEGIARAALATGNPGARAVCGLAYCDGVETRLFTGAAEGTVVLPGRGELGFGWDPVFLPAGEQLTYGELPAARKDLIGHRGKAWRAFLAALDAESQAAEK